MCNEVKTINKEVVKKLASTLTKLNTPKQVESTDKKNLFVFFNDTIGAETIQVLSDLLKDSPGTDKVYLAVPLNDKKFRKIETNYQVDMQKAGLIDQLSQIPEVKFVKLM
jgi:hypothetical protein